MTKVFNSPTIVSPIPELASPNFTISNNVLTLNYPCKNHDQCSAYSLELKAGIYRIECYGASGGRENKATSTQRSTTGTACLPQEIVTMYKGNTVCDPTNSGGSGGYISGVLKLQKRTVIFGNVGGSGVYSKTQQPKGGFNGGGDGNYYYPTGSSSGGGATDVRVGINDLYHRIIVAGGGGGTDDTPAVLGGNDDGAGGSGGYPTGQGYWITGKYYNNPIATQLFGFTFGLGESALKNRPPHPNSSYPSGAEDQGGAGGGWYGGHVSRNNQGGAGGGSSFILTIDAQIPKEEIIIHNSVYVEQSRQKYSFLEHREYSFIDVAYANGIWSGNGMIRITAIDIFNIFSCKFIIFNSHRFFLILTPIFIANNS